MSCQAMMTALTTPGLTCADRTIYAYLVGLAVDGVCGPSVQQIQTDLGIKTRHTIAACLSKLMQLALVERKRRFQGSNTYRILDKRLSNHTQSADVQETTPTAAITPTEVQETAPTMCSKPHVATPSYVQQTARDSSYLPIPESQTPTGEYQPVGDSTAIEESIATQDDFFLKAQPVNNKGAQVVQLLPKQPKHKPRRALGDWSPGERDIAWGMDRGLTRDEATYQVPKFIAHHQSKGTLSADWPANWRTWVMNKIEWAEQDRVKAAPQEQRLQW